MLDLIFFNMQDRKNTYEAIYNKTKGQRETKLNQKFTEMFIQFFRRKLATKKEKGCIVRMFLPRYERQTVRDIAGRTRRRTARNYCQEVVGIASPRGQLVANESDQGLPR